MNRFSFDIPIKEVIFCLGIKTSTALPVTHTDRWAHGLLYNSKRERSYYFDGYGEVKVGIGDVLYFPKHSDYHGRIEDDSYCDVINFQLAEDVSGLAPFVITPKNPSAIEALFKSAERAFAIGSSAARLKCIGKLYEILSIVKGELEPEYIPSKQASLIKPAIEYINEHLTEVLPAVGELAESCGISEGYFRALFSSVLGQSPIDYITTKRIELAKELIRSGLCSISEAAYSCGFTDTAYFSRSFKRITGISAREYKKYL